MKSSPQNRLCHTDERKMSSTQSELAEPGPARPWPAERIEYWSIERLIPYAGNARLHSAADIDKLVESLRRRGWTNPVLVEGQGLLLFRAGRGRPEATHGMVC